MNDILQLKGRFDTRPNSSTYPQLKLSGGKVVEVEHLNKLIEQLEKVLAYWETNKLIGGALVSVHYNSVIAKSNRLRIMLSSNSKAPTESIRGAKFLWETCEDGTVKQKHVFTYFVQLNAIKKTIDMLYRVSSIVSNEYNGRITSEDTEKISDDKNFKYKELIAKSNFLKIILDSAYVQKFDIDMNPENLDDESIVTIYKTNVETKELLSKFGITIVDDRIIDETTIRLNKDEFGLLINQAPYLIAMGVTDLAELTRDDIVDGVVEDWDETDEIIPEPTNEPTVGVIDTHFDESVYFHKWVKYKNMLDPSIKLEKEDFYHGTEVTSIIVDGPRGNPDLEDHCGRFKVRHFGVATHGQFSSFAVLRFIRTIIASNRDIKVWNLSLGSMLEIKDSFISPEAAELDRIQSEYDVVFVVAGTNKEDDSKKSMKIGSPADSLNSIVVNSVNFSNKPASYTRTGPVLSFFNKPDVSYYGGDGVHHYEKIAVCRDSTGAFYAKGTSFAAPWITRKMAYLIHIMGLSREIAKALIIDAAAGWSRKDDVSHTIGYGIVPVSIRDIIHSPEDEIRFILSGVAEDFETYTYNLPVPVVNNTHPFYARATLVYFPLCDRNQGVDYTSTEMDIHFGRIHVVKGKIKMEPINNNMQSEEGLNIIYEEDARKLYRKWDNVKHLSDIIKKRAVPRKAYESGLWGLSIKTKERVQTKSKDHLSFGVVVTLKEMNGINRIDDFMKLCRARGWFVNKLDVENKIDIYARAEEEIHFE